MKSFEVHDDKGFKSHIGVIRASEIEVYGHILAFIDDHKEEVFIYHMLPGDFITITKED